MQAIEAGGQVAHRHWLRNVVCFRVCGAVAEHIRQGQAGAPHALRDVDLGLDA